MSHYLVELLFLFVYIPIMYMHEVLMCYYVFRLSKPDLSDYDRQLPPPSPDAAAAADRQQTPPLTARGSPKTDESPRTRRRVEWSPRRQGLDASVERSRCNVESEAASGALRSPTGSLRSAHNDYLREWESIGLEEWETLHSLHPSYPTSLPNSRHMWRDTWSIFPQSHILMIYVSLCFSGEDYAASFPADGRRSTQGIPEVSDPIIPKGRYPIIPEIRYQIIPKV